MHNKERKGLINMPLKFSQCWTTAWSIN